VSLLEFALLTLWVVGLMLGRTPILMKRRPSRGDA
jgi:K+-transporting ATPase A subunit